MHAKLLQSCWLFVTLWTVLTCLINLLSTVTLWGKYHFITLRSQLKPGHISSKCQRWDLNQDLPTVQISSLLADKRETLGSFPAVPWLSIPALFWASLVAQMVKTLPAMQETWVGKIPRRRKRLPTQYSCPVNPMDRGAWWATVHGFAKSQTWLATNTFTLPTDYFPWCESLKRQMQTFILQMGRLRTRKK